MATWPTVARFEAGLTETRGSALLRVETEAGPPKQRRRSTRVMVRLAGNLLFRSKSDYSTFETFFSVAVKNGQDWFDFRHPRTGTTVQARFVGGSELGAMQYLAARGLYRLPVELEYWSA